MADYIYLLENRLSPAQKSALAAIREIALAKGTTLFLVGGAVRDLTSGSPVRDLDVVVQGSVLKWKKDLELAGAVVLGTSDAMQVVYTRFPGGVRLEVGSTVSVTYPRPGKPVVKTGTILEDLRRRDFTANAMALSLNEGSYGLLMDPLNGVADIENREIRLTGNYGFIEDPVRMIRAIRFAARLGWELEEKTKARYEAGKAEGYIKVLDDFRRGYEAEEIVHEEDPLRVMRRLEAEGWMQLLAPGWTTAKANLAELEKVRDAQTQLQMQGIHPDTSAINFPLLTAKMSVKEIAALKKSFPRQGFVAEIEALEGEAKEFANALGSRANATPSSAYRAIVGAKPEALLYVLYTSKSAALQAKFKSFMTEWPQTRQKIPYTLMQEMRITPEIEGYSELVEKLFFELMDGKLATVEEMKAFLQPYSPPAPPPPVHVRRARATKKDKAKSKGKKGAAADADLDADDEDEDSASLDGVPRGVEEDEEAEEAAEEYHAVAELGGSLSGRKETQEEEEDEQDEDPLDLRKPALETKVAVPAVERIEAPATPAEPLRPAESSRKKFNADSASAARDGMAGKASTKPVFVSAGKDPVKAVEKAPGSKQAPLKVAAKAAAKTAASPGKKVAVPAKKSVPVASAKPSSPKPVKAAVKSVPAKKR